MKMFLLRPLERFFDAEEVKNVAANPWEPWYDKAFGFVVCAKNEKSARNYASKNAGDEALYYNDKNYNKVITLNPWLDSSYTSCVELNTDNMPEAGVVVRDYASA
jgi:hypothetical protein